MHRKSVLTHCALWAAWIFLNFSWVIITGYKQPYFLVTFNFASLIAVFYGCRWMAARFWSSVENDTTMWVESDGNIVVKRPDSWQDYVFRRPVAGMLGVVFLFIVSGWYGERLLYSWGAAPAPEYPSFYYYTYAKWLVGSFYVVGGNVMAAIQYHMRQERKKMVVLEESNRQQSKEKAFITDQVKGMIDKLNRKNIEIANRLKNDQ